MVAILWIIVAWLGMPIQQPAGPSASEIDKLIERYFESERPQQIEIEKQLDSVILKAPKEIATWKDKLLKRAKNGRKAKLDALNFLIDEKKKLGKYLADDSKSSSLVVCMHGGGEGSGDAESAYGAFAGPLSKLNVLTVYPEVLRKLEHGWGEEDTERFVLDLIEAVKRTRKIDPNRIYLTGHSMGGYGTYTIGARNADTFAGLAAFAGAPTPYFDSRQRDKKVVYGIEDGILPNLRNLPIFFYQSLDDPQVTPEVNVFLKDEFPRRQKEFGGYAHRCEIVDGRKHDFPEAGPAPGVKWALSHVRDPRPKRVVWQPLRPWKRMFYWLWWENPIGGTLLDVSVSATNQITVISKLPGESAEKGANDPRDFCVFLDEKLVDVTKPVDVILNGERKFRDVPKATLATLLRTVALRNDPDLAFAYRIDLP